MKQETIAIHDGYDKIGATSVPIYQTGAYYFRDAEHANALFSLKELGDIYSRLTNPTVEVFEKRMASLDGGVAALATSSGQAATFYTVANLAKAGENILVSDKLYGGTVTLFTSTIKRFGIEARVFNSDASNLEEQIDEKTRLIFFESLSNPQICVANVEKITQIAQKHKIVSVCDNTVATPFLFNGFNYGVDVMLYSSSKYICGNGSAIGGVVVERHGLNELLKNPIYEHFNTPDDSYHGLVYTDLDMPAFTLRMRLALLRDIGACMSANTAWLMIQGLETLSIRMQKHSQNAIKIAKFLQSHPRIKSVSYPDASDEYAKKYFPDGLASGLLAFECESFEDAKNVMNSTKLFGIVTNIGDTKSLIVHPASTTHSQLDDNMLKQASLSKELIRLSVGLEDADDLIADLNQALK